ncbi:unnamed protein product [Heligmosomoides polygyrus]|uniref:Na_H_Exchanger domain-containing protein n=1 Tax=Heligmosomoides polygyrus TaxID=6339 RepID=A0A183F4Y8_HELPZ|nr:unnamed protein product [Heligmosomoides polygyrus]
MGFVLLGIAVVVGSYVGVVAANKVVVVLAVGYCAVWVIHEKVDFGVGIPSIFALLSMGDYKMVLVLGNVPAVVHDWKMAAGCFLA